jgi:molybdopterin biosynthesis enzyme
MRARQLTADDGRPAVQALAHHGSGVLSSMGATDCFIVLDAECARIDADSEVAVEPFAQQIWARPGSAF